jgi:translation initiation factor IF-3
LNNKPIINNQIRAKEVRLIDEAGQQLGVVKLEDALFKARERNLDLIQVTEKVDPPVCKIMNKGKYLYQLKKKDKGPKTKGNEIKGIRLSFNISEHDMEMRAKQTEKFFKEGNKVRIEVRLRGREKSLGNYARGKVNRFLEILQTVIPYKTERELKPEPRGLSMIISKK